MWKLWQHDIKVGRATRDHQGRIDGNLEGIYPRRSRSWCGSGFVSQGDAAHEAKACQFGRVVRFSVELERFCSHGWVGARHK